MTAPLATIAAFIHLRREAEIRIVRETDEGALCHLFSKEGHHMVELTDIVAPDTVEEAEGRMAYGTEGREFE